MSARSFLLLVPALALAPGCGGKARATDTPRPGLVHTDTDPTANLIRDLEAAVLMNYTQLSLGNDDAYMDGVAHEADLAFLGVSSGDVMVGPGARSNWVASKPYHRAPGVRVFSKNLRVSLSRDKQVGWISDEISYRVPVDVPLGEGGVVQRVASIPMRVTAAFVRDVDRWVMVMEHVSYGLRAGDIIDMARARELRFPSKLPREGSIAERTADDIAAVVEAFHRKGDERQRRAIASDDRVVLMLPDPSAEYVGEEVQNAPELAELFGGGSVQVLSTRVSARIGRTAWMLANLRISAGTPEDRALIPARGSYILEAQREQGEWRWRIVQAHISVGLDKQQLDRRVFGPASKATIE